jgi:hypothetical protein
MSVTVTYDRCVRIAALAVLPGCITALTVTQPAVITDTATPFDLPSHLGRTIALHDALADGPVVLVFYRGFW